ncbi:hypothetical protein BTI679_09590 [Bacillus wiedmannii]|nr:hypothetical protein BTI679_09590 [Bacillus wiedmannii]
MLEQLIIELAKLTKQVEDINGDKTYLVINKDDEGLYVEAKFSREQYEGEATPYFKVSFEILKDAWRKFIAMRTVKSEDFGQASECNTFLVAFFSQLPFVNVMGAGAITFKEAQTDNLPSEKYDKVMLFLEEIINGTYNPSTLSEQMDENLYSRKSRARQDLRLLGFLNESHEMNQLLLSEYVQSEDKKNYMAQLVLKQEYFRHVLFVLGLLEKYSKDEKKEALVDFGMTIVRNSLGDNLMVDSVAKRRTNNLLDWVEQVGLINNEWILVEQYVKDDGEKGGSMNSNLREKFLTVMNEYLQAKTERFAGHKMGSVVRNELTTEITRLPFIDHNQYVVTRCDGNV